jgi:hypothetical protein
MDKLNISKEIGRNGVNVTIARDADGQLCVTAELHYYSVVHVDRENIESAITQAINLLLAGAGKPL